MIRGMKKVSMILTALAVVVCTSSSVSASAYIRLKPMYGYMYKAIVLDNGLVTFRGYTKNCPSGCYQSDGEYISKIEGDNKYEYCTLEKYGDKYTKTLLETVDEDTGLVDHSKDKTYLIDLTSGKVDWNKSLEEKKDEIAENLQEKLSKTDGYGNNIEKPLLVETVKDKFGEVWYQYIVEDADSDNSVPKVNVNFKNEVKENAIYGFVNEEGNYIEAYDLSNAEDDICDKKINEYVGTLGQDENYFYTLVKVSDGNWYIQQISKTTGTVSDIHDYRLTAEVVKFLNEKNSDGFDEGVYGQVVIKDGWLISVQLNKNMDKVKITNINLIPSNGEYTGLVTLGNTFIRDVGELKDDEDEEEYYDWNEEKFKFDTIKRGPVSIDINNNVWILNCGKIYKFDGQNFQEKFSCVWQDFKMLEVYDDNNLVASSDNERYCAYQDGKSYAKPLIAK